MRCGCVGEQSFSVEYKQLVDAVGQYLAFHFALDACTGNHGVEFNTELVGQLASFGE